MWGIYIQVGQTPTRIEEERKNDSNSQFAGASGRGQAQQQGRDRAHSQCLRLRPSTGVEAETPPAPRTGVPKAKNLPQVYLRPPYRSAWESSRTDRTTVAWPWPPLFCITSGTQYRPAVMTTGFMGLTTFSTSSKSLQPAMCL